MHVQDRKPRSSEDDETGILILALSTLVLGDVAYIFVHYSLRVTYHPHNTRSHQHYLLRNMELRSRKAKRKADTGHDSDDFVAKRERIGDNLVMIRRLGETRHRNCMCGTMEVTPVSTPSNAPFFTKLPQEIRDQVYHWLWLDTPRILQRFRRKVYFVSYGEQITTYRGDHTGRVRFQFQPFVTNFNFANQKPHRYPGF
jgi:hypothetical protein